MEFDPVSRGRKHNALVAGAVFVAAIVAAYSFALMFSPVLGPTINMLFIWPGAMIAIVRLANRKTALITLAIGVVASLAWTIIYGETGTWDILSIAIGWAPSIAFACLMPQDHWPRLPSFRKMYSTRKRRIITGIAVLMLVSFAVFRFTDPPVWISCSHVQSANWPSADATHRAARRQRPTQRQAVAEAIVRCGSYVGRPIDIVTAALGDSQGQLAGRRSEREIGYYIGVHRGGIGSELLVFDYDLQSRRVLRARIVQT